MREKAERLPEENHRLYYLDGGLSVLGHALAEIQRQHPELFNRLAKDAKVQAKPQPKVPLHLIPESEQTLDVADEQPLATITTLKPVSRQTPDSPDGSMAPVISLESARGQQPEPSEAVQTNVTYLDADVIRAGVERALEIGDKDVA